MSQVRVSRTAAKELGFAAHASHCCRTNISHTFISNLLSVLLAFALGLDIALCYQRRGVAAALVPGARARPLPTASGGGGIGWWVWEVGVTLVPLVVLYRCVVVTLSVIVLEE